jgi:hypothetical protein
MGTKLSTLRATEEDSCGGTHAIFFAYRMQQPRAACGARMQSDFSFEGKIDQKNIMLNSVPGGEFYIWAARFSGIASACDCPQMMAWQRTKETQCHL